MPNYMDKFLKMVIINSFSRNPDGVNFLGDFTARAFSELGFSYEKIQSRDMSHGKHLVLTRKGRSDIEISCISHLDTVYTSHEEQKNDFSWRVEGDRIYGPGTIDIKGGTIVMFMMLDALNTVMPREFNGITWKLLFNATEEIDSTEFINICTDRMNEKSPACLVFEAGKQDENDIKVVTARKGRAIVKIRTIGKSSHSGVNHAEGANAIVQLAEILNRVHNMTDYEKDITVNIGKITGGTLINRVPNFAEAEIEIRSHTKELFDDVFLKIKDLENYSSISSADNSFSCKTYVELVREAPAWPENDMTNSLLKYWEESGADLGVKITTEKRGGLSDGNFLWNRGPTIDGLGPAGENAHSSEWLPDGTINQEYAVKSSLVLKAVLNAIAVLRIINDNLTPP